MEAYKMNISEINNISKIDHSHYNNKEKQLGT